MAVYYVATTGGTGAGTIGSPWSFSHAVSQAQAGDTVWVKAGNYGTFKFASVRSGSSGNPIIFKGYKSTIGDSDLPANTYGYNYSDYVADNYKFTSTELPLLENSRGSNNTPLTSDIAFQVSHDYIVLENFRAQFHYYGFNIGGNHVRMRNCAVQETGNWDRNDPSWGLGFGTSNLNGIGIRVIGGDYFTMEGCFSANSGHENFISISNTNTVTRYNITVTNRLGNASDYMFVWYNSHNFLSEYDMALRYNSVDTGSYLTNLPNGLTTGDPLPHKSRGFAFKKGSSGGVWRKSYTYNTRVWFYLRANNNTGYDNVIEGSGESFTGDLIFGDAGGNNVLYNTKLILGYLQFTDLVGEGESFDGCGDNIFVNTIMVGTTNNAATGAFIGITNNLWNAANATQISRGTQTFYGGTFIGSNNFIRRDAPFTALNFYNVNFVDISNNMIVRTSQVGYNGTAGSINFYNCNADNIPFSLSGSGNVSYPSNFTNKAGGDYTLNSNSQLIGKGLDTSVLFPTSNIDFNNSIRTVPYDIGVFEVGGTPPEPSTPGAGKWVNKNVFYSL